jgi:hypothetical protein
MSGNVHGYAVPGQIVVTHLKFNLPEDRGKTTEERITALWQTLDALNAWFDRDIMALRNTVESNAESASARKGQSLLQAVGSGASESLAWTP